MAARFAAADPDAIRDLYVQYSGPVTTVAASILRDPQLAQDAVQQTFLNAWRGAHSFDPSRDIAPWLYAIARRAAIDIHRAEQRRRTEGGHDLDVAVTPLAFDRTWEAWEVRRALGELPDDEREIVRLAHFEGRTHSEIAALTGIALGTVKSRSHRAHKRLAHALRHLVDTENVS